MAARLAPPPPGPAVVERRRLLMRLRDADTPVIALCAPPGYGKTTLLAQFAATDPRPLAWLTLEPDEEDAATLIRGVAAALDRTEPVGQSLIDALSAGTPTLIPRALPRLASTLLARTQPLLLVLDGTERLRSRLAQDALRVLIDHLPEGSTLLMGARGALPPRTAKLRAEGRLGTLGPEELRADDGELREMLLALGVRASRERLRSVADRSEGWPVAVYLSAIAMREGGEAAFGERPRGYEAPLSEYFQDEVIALARHGDAAFLRRASVLDRLSAEACDAVLERDDSGRVLERLARGNLFITPAAGDGGAYAMHPLFAEALRAALARDEPALAPELHRRASGFYAARGRTDAAVRHALEAGDVDGATTLVFSVMPGYEAGGRTSTLVAWLALFPEVEIERRPALALTRAWTRIDAGDGDGARVFLALARRAGKGDRLPGGAPVEALAALTEAALTEGGVAEVTRLSVESRALEDEEQPWDCVALLFEGACRHITGDRERATGLLRECVELSGTLMPSVNALALSQLALMAIEAGDFDGAGDLAGRARSRVDGNRLNDYAPHAFTFAVSALVAARRGELDLAVSEARHSAGLLALVQHVSPWLTAQATVVLTRAQLRMGDLAAARALASDAQRALRGLPDAVLLHELLDDAWARIQASGLELPLGPSSLTTAERRVLQHLPSHLSFRQIGERLHVSQNTVKTQALAVYRKLDVNSRSDAVRRGQELGLLDS
ncbi:MAG: LuxR C-terminal-related transcriptional regulator [Solirubrobacteraceae bacterium]